GIWPASRRPSPWRRWRGAPSGRITKNRTSACRRGGRARGRPPAGGRPRGPPGRGGGASGEGGPNRPVERAMLSNTDLRVAVERLREARAQRGVVAADLFPHADLNGSYSNSRFSENGFLQGLPGSGSGGGSGLPGAIFPGQQINL